MSAEPNSKPEPVKTEVPASVTSAAASAAESSRKETAKADATKPETAEDKDFAKKSGEKLQEYTKKVEALRKKFDSQGSIGKTKADMLTERQKIRLEKVANQKNEEYRSLIESQKAQRKSLMLGEIHQEMEKIYWPYERIIDYCRGMDKIDDADLVKLEAIMESMNKMRTNPEAEKIFMKVLSKQQLKPEDYQQIATLLKPTDLGKEIADSKGAQIFESAQMGAIIGVMNPAQRMELLNVLLKVKPPQENEQFLDMFMTAGIFSQTQILSLCDQGKIPEPQKTNLKNKITQGEIGKKQNDYQQKIDQLTKVNQGRTAENPLNKSFGMPGLLALSALWGAAVALINFKINFDWKKPGESLSRLAGNPYFLGGLAASGVGVAGVASIIDPQGTQSLTDKIFGSKKDKEARSAEDLAKIRELMEVPLNTNPYLLKFLTTEEIQSDGKKKSGFSLLQEISRNKAQKGKGGRIAIEDKSKTDEDKALDHLPENQKKLFEQALGCELGNKFALQDKINAFLAGCTFEGIIGDQKLKTYLTKYNQKNGLTEATV